MSGFDVWVRGGTLVTMDPERRVLRGDLWIRDGELISVGGPRPLPHRPARIVDAAGAAVLPGFVQAHVHLCQAMFRGRAGDLPLLPWLETRIWPLEGAHTAASLRISALIGLHEMTLTGTTTILDMGTVHHQDAVFEAMREAGVRGLSGKAMMDRGAPPSLAETASASLSESLRLAATVRDDPRLGYAFAPRFILSVSEGLLRDVAGAAEELGALLHTHAAEHAEERETVRQLLGKDDIAALDEAGAIGPRTVLAHGVQLRAEERRRLAEAGTRIAHCPSANLKLGSGVADVPALRAAGITVGLGADGAPCNDRMDAFTELRSAALLAKGVRQDAVQLPALEALELLTCDGAKALGLADRIGSLEEGKRADVLVVDLEGPHQRPPSDDVASTLVYATRGSDVRHVMIDGELVVQSGEHRLIDGEALKAQAREAAVELERRAGLRG